MKSTKSIFEKNHSAGGSRGPAGGPHACRLLGRPMTTSDTLAEGSERPRRVRRPKPTLDGAGDGALTVPEAKQQILAHAAPQIRQMHTHERLPWPVAYVTHHLG